MRNDQQLAPEDVRVTLHGSLPGIDEYAQKQIAKVIHQAPEPVLDARVRLVRHEDPAVARPITAQANLDVNGHPVRAQVQAATGREAVDLLEGRLRRALDRFGRHWQAVRGRTPTPEPHEWRHSAEPEHRPGYFPRPSDDREVIRHKTYALAEETVDEAAYEMDQMDYDFHLFTEIGTGSDSVLYRNGPTGYRLAQMTPTDPAKLGPHAVSLTLSEQPAAQLDLPEAIERLNLTELPFVFFSDRDSKRGHLLYRRYDGHYGLIAPTE